MTAHALEPRQGYDLAASSYEDWRWCAFWRDNEAPVVRRWLRYLAPGEGLDAGSGTGPYLLDAVRCGHRCVALDLSGNMLAVNQEKSVGWFPPVRHIQGDLRSLPFADNTFDWILCSRVLSHVAEIDLALQEFARTLKKGGEALISDVHPNHPYTNVAIPCTGGKIRIKTYKHPLETTKEAICRVPDLKLVRLKQYHLDDLPTKPSPANFKKFYRYRNPAVFYVAWLRKG